MEQRNSNKHLLGGNGAWSRPRVRAVALGLLTVLGVYLCYRLAQPCIPALVWAGALALIFAPLQRWMEARVRRPNLAAGLSLVIIGLLVVVPTTWFAQKLAEQAVAVPQAIEKQLATGKWHLNSNEHPSLANFLALLEQQIGSSDYPGAAMNYGKTLLSKLVKQSAIAAVQVCLTLYFLFYFLRDRARVLGNIRWFLPLSDEDTDEIFFRINETIHATLYGMLAMSVLQGLLGGLMFCWLGVPSPWFWALLAALFAFVPVVDTFVLWLPAAVFLGLEGRWGEALGIAVLGTLLVRGIENFLYPALVKNRLRVPSMSIFITLVGGLLLFGWSGLVLGPVLLTVTSALLKICAKRFGEPQPEVRNSSRPTAEAVKPTHSGADLEDAVAVLPAESQMGNAGGS